MPYSPLSQVPSRLAAEAGAAGRMMLILAAMTKNAAAKARRYGMSPQPGLASIHNVVRPGTVGTSRVVAPTIHSHGW
jgi:hypothetical protein